MNRLSQQRNLILNLGSGSNKIKGSINIDIEDSCKPDLVCDFRHILPFPNDFVDKIQFFHVIEHIESKFHEGMLNEFWRVLKPGGQLYISYPEFVAVAKNYINNERGLKEFWKNTIYGRQLYKSDYHVSLMDSRDFFILLDNCGFKNIVITEESKEEKFNSICYATKGGKKFTYEDSVNLTIFGKIT